tara:strand:+ start:6155 stop:6973 length:819 start_codon:yes stop_codon:yes gene_type:complete
MNILFYKDNFLEKDKFYIDINNRSFRYSDSCFETIKIINYKVFNQNAHLYRIRKAICILRFVFNHTDNYIISVINNIIIKNKICNGIIKLYLIRESGGLYLPKSNNCNLFVEAHTNNNTFKYNSPTSLYIYNKEVKTKCQTSNIKSSATLISVLASIEAKKHGFENAMLFNSEGYIIEASNSNIFIVKDNIIYTPPIEDGCVDGTMRNLICNLFSIINKSISLEMIEKSDEVFISNSINGVIPINKIGAFNYKSHIFSNMVQKKLISLIQDP